MLIYLNATASIRTAARIFPSTTIVCANIAIFSIISIVIMANGFFMMNYFLQKYYIFFCFVNMYYLKKG